jgi:hypothetical protein
MMTVSIAKDHAVIRVTLASTSASFVPKATEAEQQTIDQAWICLTPRHLACPLLVAPRPFFAPGRLNKWQTETAKNS